MVSSLQVFKLPSACNLTQDVFTSQLECKQDVSHTTCISFATLEKLVEHVSFTTCISFATLEKLVGRVLRGGCVADLVSGRSEGVRQV